MNSTDQDRKDTVKLTAHQHRPEPITIGVDEDGIAHFRCACGRKGVAVMKLEDVLFECREIVELNPNDRRRE